VVSQGILASTVGSHGGVVGGLSSRGVVVVQSTTLPAASMHGGRVVGGLSSLGVVLGGLSSRGVVVSHGTETPVMGS